MGKIYIDSIKYVIHASFKVNGLVDRPDIVGALFGQTEGLLGDELDLRELQKSGKIGRIEVTVHRKNGKTEGKVLLPSSLDLIETAVIAAALETVDRVGPYEAEVKVERIEDTRSFKRKYIIERAKELLRSMVGEEIPETREIIEAVKEELRTSEIRTYGPEKLPAGPEIEKADEIIVVEGRADVLNLLKYGIKNVIGLDGAKIPKSVVNLAKRKKVTLFVDGDRGGDMVIREFMSRAKVDYIARAPPGREVEELTQKEILKALRKKVPVGIKKGEEREVGEEKKEKEKRVEEDIPDRYVEAFGEVEGKLEAIIFKGDEDIARIPVRELFDKLKEIEEADAIVFDGIVTQRLIDAAHAKGVKYIVGVKEGRIERLPEGMVIGFGTKKA